MYLTHLFNRSQAPTMGFAMCLASLFATHVVVRSSSPSVATARDFAISSHAPAQINVSWFQRHHLFSTTFLCIYQPVQDCHMFVIAVQPPPCCSSPKIITRSNTPSAFRLSSVLHLRTPCHLRVSIRGCLVHDGSTSMVQTIQLRTPVQSQLC